MLKLILGHQDSSGLIGAVISDMPGKTISDLSVLPERPKSIKHFSSCVGSKNNYSVIYYCKKKKKLHFSQNVWKKNNKNHWNFMCLWLEEDLRRRIWVGWLKWVPVYVCVNVTTCQINKGLRSMNMTACELQKNSDSWPGCMLAQQSEPKFLFKHTQDCEKFNPASIFCFRVCCCPKQVRDGPYWLLFVTDGPKFSTSIWKCLLWQLCHKICLYSRGQKENQRSLFSIPNRVLPEEKEKKLLVNI